MALEPYGIALHPRRVAEILAGKKVDVDVMLTYRFSVSETRRISISAPAAMMAHLLGNE